jgi:hypothetical protein
MSTPKYDQLIAKVRMWSGKQDMNNVTDGVLIDCLKYSADEAYRNLRIPPLEWTTQYTVEAADNGTEKYTSFYMPEDLTQFNYIRTLNGIGSPYQAFPSNTSIVFNEVTDKRTFFDIYSEKYSVYNWMWQDNKVFIHPQLEVGTVLEINYYRRLPALDAVYNVSAVNYVIGVSDALQPYLELDTSELAQPLYFSTSGGIEKVFDTLAEAQAYNPTVTTKEYVGKETTNWLRDNNERLLIFGALYNLGAFLFDDNMEQRYEKKFMENLFTLNKEEKFRRAAGGNVRMHANTNGLI